ncbi:MULTISPECIES: tyrosine-type recombinase/integrase [Sphingomonadales]|uniref:Integrase n=1 Tax=Sphingobium ummariense RL-3 TaxID=1346791 RepID=T0KCX8_9SPHN|nr:MULTISPECIES: site-specific integrase [Sphingomonadaceae]EQB31358.1 integrase [Sphingobium ummariense RL-3]WOF45874.1 site-specific integrase [Sphingopyxis indica]
MPKLTKKFVDALQHTSGRDMFAWDTEVRGFGIRVKPSGTKTFLIQYRNAERRTRRYVIGQYGILTVERARDLAQKKLASVIDGGDPSEERHAARDGLTVAEICDWYLEEAEAGRLLGRNRRPIKASSVAGDRSRIEQHIKPLVGTRLVSHLKLGDIEALQADIAAGKSARKKTCGRGGKTSGGAGVAGRAISTLRSLLNHARRHGMIEQSPANGVRVIASDRLKRHLSVGEVRHLGKIMTQMEREGEHPTGLAAIRAMLLTGFRRMEVLAMRKEWIEADDNCVAFPETKSGAQMRAAGDDAVIHLLRQAQRSRSAFVFPADWGDGHFVGVVRVLDRVCARAGLEDVTPHVLRHTFASIAASLGFSELTIAGLLGHGPRGVTQRYVHLDAALVIAADQVAAEIARLLDGGEIMTMKEVKRRRFSEMYASLQQ